MHDMIKIDSLSKSFGEIKAVQDLSFRVKEGELFAFLGVNGAGKSTTINIMCGQLAKDAGYGFICGAYMPVSQFSEGLQKVISFLPGTYGTSLLRNHALRGVFEEMDAKGFPPRIVEAIRDSVDCNLYFFGDKVESGSMYLIVIAAVIFAVALYVAMNMLPGKKKR